MVIDPTTLRCARCQGNLALDYDQLGNIVRLLCLACGRGKYLIPKKREGM